MPHTVASDPETSWKSAAKEIAPWSKSGCLQALAVSSVMGESRIAASRQFGLRQRQRLRVVTGSLVEQICGEV